MASIWSGNYSAPNWSGNPSVTSNTLYTIDGGVGSNPQIGIIYGNQVTLPTDYNNLTVATQLTTSSIVAKNITSQGTVNTQSITFPFSSIVTAYENILYINGIAINSGLPDQSNVSQWATYEAVADIYANHCNLLAVNGGYFSSIQTSSIKGVTATFSNIYTSSVMTSTINAVSGNFSSIAVSSIGAIVGNFSTLTVSSFNYPGLSNTSSNWSQFPAITDVNLASHSINNIAQVNANYVTTSGITINGTTQFNGHANWSGTGNTFQPYWYDFHQDVNMFTGNSGMIYPPRAFQYWEQTNQYTNAYDPITFSATTTTFFQLASAGVIYPTGYISLLANNYHHYIPLLYDDAYRGQLNIGTQGSGANANITFNYDGYEYLANVGASININADSFLTGNPVFALSRVSVLGGNTEDLATSSSLFLTGYVKVDPVYTAFCELTQHLLEVDSSDPLNPYPSQVFITRGGSTSLIYPQGARTDVAAVTFENCPHPSQMNLYSSQRLFLYGDQDVYIGYGGGTPRYGWNSGSQQIHVINATDIQGKSGSGMTVTNTNSISFTNSNSFIKNIAYLTGYTEDVSYEDNYTIQSIPVVSSLAFASSINVFGQTLSTFVYTSTVRVNHANISTLASSIKQTSNNSYNYIKGISTFLQDYSYEGYSLALSNTIQSFSSIVQPVVYPTALPNIITPTQTLTPVDMKYAISSITNVYQYSTITQINDYNVTLSSPSAYYPLNSSICYNQGFSNILNSEFADSLYLVGGWSNSQGFIDVYNQGDIPIYFLSQYPNEGALVSPNTNSRVTFQGVGYDPPIEVAPITPTGLSSFSVSSLYVNNTYFTQTPDTTILEIDRGGYDTDNNPITGLGTLVINANVALSNISVTDLNVDYISAYCNADVSVLCNVQMNYNSIENVNGIAVDYLINNSNTYIQFPGGLIDMANGAIQNVGTIGVDFINPNANAQIDFNNNIITGVDQIYLNTISLYNTDGRGAILVTNNLAMNNNYISGVNGIYVDEIYPNNTGIVSIPGTISNVDIIYLDSTWYSIPDTSDFYNVRMSSYPGSSFSAPFYLSYATTPSDASAFNYTPVAADWSLFPATNTVDMSNQRIENATSIAFTYGSQITETNYGANYLSINNQTLIQCNVVIQNDYGNPTLKFDSGKIAYIDFQSNFHISCNVSMMNNSISNVANFGVSTINNRAVPIHNWGKATANTTVTLSNFYTGSNTYAITATYTNAITNTFIPPFSCNASTSNFYLGGTGTQQIYWVAVGT